MEVGAAPTASLVEVCQARARARGAAGVDLRLKVRASGRIHHGLVDGDKLTAAGCSILLNWG